VIIDRPDRRFQGLWDRLKKSCANWIGFDPSRCQESEGLAQLSKRKSAEGGSTHTIESGSLLHER
jgi:hypothetical protein